MSNPHQEFLKNYKSEWYEIFNEYSDIDPYKEFLNNYIPEWYEVFDEYSDIDSDGNIFIYKKHEDGVKIWTNEKNEYHRTDGPAYIGKRSIYFWTNNKVSNWIHSGDMGDYVAIGQNSFGIRR